MTFATRALCTVGPLAESCNSRLPQFFMTMFICAPSSQHAFLIPGPHFLLAAGPLFSSLIGCVLSCIHCPCVLHVSSGTLVFLLASAFPVLFLFSHSSRHYGNSKRRFPRKGFRRSAYGLIVFVKTSVREQVFQGIVFVAFSPQVVQLNVKHDKNLIRK